VSTGGQGAPPAGGWHPDPAGRFEHRWWDGYRWTDQVSTAGSTATDPAGGLPDASEVSPTAAAERTLATAAGPDPALDRRLFESASFAIDVTDGGLDGGGTWWARLHDGTPIGHIGAGLGGRAQWAEVQDPANRVLLRLAQDPLAGTHGLAARDGQGRMVGVLARQGDDDGTVDLRAPTPGAPPDAPFALYGTLHAFGKTVVAGFPDSRPVLDPAGLTVGGIRVIDNTREKLVWDKRPVQQSWMLVDRDPALPDPLRTLIVAAVPMLAACIVQQKRRTHQQLQHHRQINRMNRM
jgi:hypothetical protein